MNSIRLLVLAAVIGTGSVTGHHAFAQDAVTQPAVQKRVVTTVSAPARVQAAASTVLTAPTAGGVFGLHVLPAEEVGPGQTIFPFGGPTVSTEAARLAAAAKSAQRQVSAATP